LAAGGSLNGLFEEAGPMANLKLTKRAIEKLPAPHPTGKQQLVWDTELKGFGVLVSGATTEKTYVVQHKLKDGRTRRVTVGPVNAIDLDGEDGARARARKVIGEIYAGADPKATAARRARRSRRRAPPAIAARSNGT